MRWQYRELLFVKACKEIRSFRQRPGRGGSYPAYFNNKFGFSPMRKILGVILCLGLSMVVLGLFQRAAEVARWSQIFGILGETGKANPLEDGHVRERFNALYWEDRSIIPTIFTCFGALTSIFSMAALFIHKSEGRPGPMILSGGAPVASDT